MFESSKLPKSLDEKVFESWLENGRESKMSYLYLFIIWDAVNEQFIPVYSANRTDIQTYESIDGATGREQLVAAYDLYSESRIHE